MEPDDMYKAFRSFTYSGDAFSREKAYLTVETPLEIIINGQSHILIMFTPGQTRELVLGFLFTEGLINSVSEIEECIISTVSKKDGEQVIEARVTIPSEGSYSLETKGKRVSYSSCGICGKENYYDLKIALGRVKSRHRFSMEILQKFPQMMHAMQPLYEKTGGSHAAILFDEKGNPQCHCEDMGRHNALDKLVGCILVKGIPCEDKILCSSGRASLEMILKSARAGIPVFLAMSRPTSRAVEAAKFYNITLMDMAKGSNRIYSHARRIKRF
jgi:FdhD protein